MPKRQRRINPLDPIRLAGHRNHDIVPVYEDLRALAPDSSDIYVVFLHLPTKKLTRDLILTHAHRGNIECQRPLLLQRRGRLKTPVVIGHADRPASWDHPGNLNGEWWCPTHHQQRPIDCRRLPIDYQLTAVHYTER